MKSDYWEQILYHVFLPC